MGEGGIEPLNETTPINSTDIFLPLYIHEFALFKYPELFVLCSSVIKKDKLQNIPAPQVYHEWVEVVEKITDQWWNSDTF